ncbi:MAG: TRAP transporter small permease [Pseudomonadota bacterium]|jgi:TRAP-type C4-dicarboxylate transport system, small permease component|nr:MAG: TRAP transporter small permease [Pseudomonadota bacterium]
MSHNGQHDTVDTEAMFEEWRKQESRVPLDDLRPQDAIVFLVYWALFAIVLLQFWTRYVLNDSYGWTEEISRYLLIAVTFIGSVTAMRKGTHIAVEAVITLAPRAVRHWTLVVIDGLVTLFCGAMAWYGYLLGARAPGYMVSVDIPKSIVYWMVSAALAGMTVHAAIRFVQRLRGTLGDETTGAVLD